MKALYDVHGVGARVANPVLRAPDTASARPSPRTSDIFDGADDADHQRYVSQLRHPFLY